MSRTRSDTGVFAPDARGDLEPRAGASSTPSDARASVLLVDDRPANLDALEATLLPLDLRLVRATSATEALREVLRNDFAVILLDVRLPDLDGPETARLIKARARSEVVPIIFITALERDRRRITAAYESGAVDYLTKPFDPAVLRAKVHAFVELHRKREDATWRQRRRFADLAEEARIESEAAQRTSEERLRLALDVARMVAWEWEPGVGRVRTTGNLLDIYGVASLDDLTAAFLLVHPEDRERHAATVRTAAQRGTSYRSEYRIVRPDTGSVVWLEERGSPIRDGRGKVVKMVGSVLDVSERKRNEGEREGLLAAEREARAKAEVADRAKSDFLATMSHEFRTPLNAIVGYVELLETGIPGAVTEQQRDYLTRLRSSGRHLIGMVDDVLDLAKVEAGQLTVNRERAVVSAAVAAAVAIAERDAAARGIAVTNLCAQGPSIYYAGDEHRVRQVLINLLSNAAKFTDPGGRITIDCATVDHLPPKARTDHGGPWVVVRVRDTGIGIPTEQQEAIFGAFHQVERGKTRTRGGTGLGLAVSRGLARLMGGDLTVESEVGQGSEFSLWLAGAPEAGASEE